MRADATSGTVVGRGLAVAAWMLTTGGCGDVAREAAGAGTPVAVRRGLDEMVTPASQGRLNEIAGSPAFQKGGYGVGLGIGRGIVDEEMAFMGGRGTVAGEPAPAVGLAATTRAGVAVPASAVPPATTQGVLGTAAAVPGGLNPVVGDLVRSAVTEGMGQATGPAGRAQLRAVAEAAGDALVTGMAKAADREAGPVVERLLRDRLGPALDEAARTRLGPAVRDLLREQVGPVVHDVVREAVVDSARGTLQMAVEPANAANVVTNARNASQGASSGSREALIGSGLLDRTGRLSAGWRVVGYAAGTLVTLIGVATLALLVLRILTAWSDYRRSCRRRRRSH